MAPRDLSAPAGRAFAARASGILMHVTSLPAQYGIGDLGPEAYRFVDFLARARQRYWQVLPLTPANYRNDHSPYNCASAFGGNKYLISPELLVQAGFLDKSELDRVPRLPRHLVRFPAMTRFKDRIFEATHDRFCKTGRRAASYARFCAENRSWLDDFALFAALNAQHPGTWRAWPAAVRSRDPGAIRSLRRVLRRDVEREKFLQYIFHGQWRSLRQYCNARQIKVIGDLPIYVDFNSVDVWSHPALFRLDPGLRPLYLSGVPPDYFSRDGQLWGNPVYDWRAMARAGFEWWRQRFLAALKLYDRIRLDHFRGYVAYWQVRSRARTAKHGQWVKAPAVELLTALQRAAGGLPVIAEDLGLITPDVREIIERFDLPGMKVLLFAFGDGDPGNPYLPHNHIRNCVVYTGTHDNNTVRGWYEKEAAEAEKQRLAAYLGHKVIGRSVHEAFVRMALASVADTAIIPMQDVLGLAGNCRMNRPSSTRSNWQWRVTRSQLAPAVADRLARMTATYGRA